ncbi:MAG: FecR protein, partial [Actinobacteria bacterium]
MRTKGMIGLMLAFGLLAGVISLSHAADPSEPQEDAIGRTPARLSFVDGQVSFWRPGADDWAQAQINTPLAPGDQLSTGTPGNLELQIGTRAFVRAWANTQLGLENQEPDFLQLKVTAGRVAFDLRTLESGHTVEVATPSAAFTIEHPGYYRVDVSGERTAFITRRAGRATVIPAIGEPFAIAASEEVVLDGVASPQIRSYAAPPLDEWDKWNYARTDALLDAVSARYVPPGTYGVDDLDRHGDWRVVDTYGPVWVPRGVPTGWAPYSTGSWVLDPFYGWTWLDTASWGWAPYHYGRWVSVNSFWAWAPGPVVVRPVYAPALVAFFGGPGVRVSVGVGGPLVGWVALGWGEPCIPWWGRPGFVHRPWWGGWGGPRVVNNVVIHRTTVVNVEHITVYRNAHVRNAVVAVREDRFGRGHIRSARVAQVDPQHLRPIHTGPRVSTTPASFVPTVRSGVRPPEASLKRPV